MLPVASTTDDKMRRMECNRGVQKMYESELRAPIEPHHDRLAFTRLLPFPHHCLLYDMQPHCPVLPRSPFCDAVGE